MHKELTGPETRREAGFTLVEVVVVLGVILLLAGIAVPLVNGYVEDGQRARARSEVKMLGAALMSMYKDTGVYPARDGDGSNDEIRVLGSGGTKPESNPFANNSSWNAWYLSSSYGDTFDNHLNTNTPGDSSDAAYPTTGEFQWRGPYLADDSPLDPWGRPYLCMVRSFYDNSNTYYKRVILLSAGPNGQIETSATCSDNTDIEGDDIGFVLSQR